MGLRKFLAPEIVFGIGARNLVANYIKNYGITKVFVVTDKNLYKTKWIEELENNLKKRDIEYTIFYNVSENPRSEEVMLGVESYIKNRCNGIVALGGGSPMDFAKGVGIVANNGGDILDYEGVDKVIFPIPPLIFIPTTAGSSADVSQFSIINNSKRLVKIAIISKNIVPDIALIDPETTITMDVNLTAYTGMDAMTHAIEAFVSNASSGITDIHALKAISLVREYLPKVVREPNNLEYREKMMFASMQAGLAFSNAILGAVHAMAHSLGGFKDLPHGKCNSMLLEHVINFNYDSAVDKYDIISNELLIDTKGLSGKEKRIKLVNKVIELKNQVGIFCKLGNEGIGISDIPELSKKAIDDPCMITNPKKLNLRDIEVIYEEAR